MLQLPEDFDWFGSDKGLFPQWKEVESEKLHGIDQVKFSDSLCRS